jgi:hypothetical protein
MGDGRAFSTGNNRFCSRHPNREEDAVLEWKPRLIAVLLVLIAIAVVAGFVELDTLVDNWEW